MTWPLRAWFFVLVMLVSGVCNTIFTKQQDNTCVRHCDDPDPMKRKKFEQPVLQTAQMFVGEMACWLWIGGSALHRRILQWNKSRRQTISDSDALDHDAVAVGESTPLIRQETLGKPDDVLRGWRVLKLAYPAVCDIIATTLMNIGLLFLTASIYQMTRGSQVIAVGVFSRIFLNSRLSWHRWAALAGVMVGVAVVGLAGIIYPDPEVKVTVSAVEGVSASGEIAIGVIIILVAQLFSAGQFVLEERWVNLSTIEPVEVIAYEGLYGLIITVIAMVGLHFAIGRSEGGKYGMFDMVEGFRQMSENSEIGWTSVLIMFSIAFFNLSGLSITRVISATSRSTIDTCRTLFIWFYSLYKGWEEFKGLQLLGFAILFFATLFYNQIIPLPCVSSRPDRQEQDEEQPLLAEQPTGHR